VDLLEDLSCEILPEYGLDLAAVFEGALAVGLLLGGGQGRLWGASRLWRRVRA